MTKKLKTFNRSDLEEKLSLEFPQLGKEKISSAIDAIINTITEAVALDNNEDKPVAMAAGAFVTGA